MEIHVGGVHLCQESTIHLWFLGLLKNKCRITLLRHAEPNEPPKALELKFDAVLDSARYRSFGSAADGSDNVSVLSN